MFVFSSHVSRYTPRSGSKNHHFVVNKGANTVLVANVKLLLFSATNVGD